MIEASVLRERIRGSLFGAAIGDALGSAFEFVGSSEIERAIGANVVTDYLPALSMSLLAPRSPGNPTDDTAMTLALVEAIVEGDPRSPASLLNGIVERLRRKGGPVADMFWNGGPGGACLSMLREAENGAGPFERINAHAGGNGAAMRAHPCGAFSDRIFVAELASMQARLSHPEPAAEASAQVVALIVHEALYKDTLASNIPPEITNPKLLSAWTDTHSDMQPTGRLPQQLLDVDMAGWNTVAAAHAIAMIYADKPALAVGLAAASGADTDTVASIVGGMLGALHGIAAFLERWIEKLQGRDLIERAAQTLFDRVQAI